MMLKSLYLKIEAKEELSRIEPLTSRFLLSDLDLDFFARKFQITVHKHRKMVYCTYKYHHILLSFVALQIIMKCERTVNLPFHD
jgi:hypothetical protein